MLEGVPCSSYNGTPLQRRKQAGSASGQTAFNPASGDLSVQLQPKPISVLVGPRWAVGQGKLCCWACPTAKWQGQRYVLAISQECRATFCSELCPGLSPSALLPTHLVKTELE